MKRLLAAVLVGLTTAAAAHAQTIDAATQAKLDEAARLGREINDHDQSAWHVTDALFAVKRDAPQQPIAFITERTDPTHVKTIFFIKMGEVWRTYFTGVTEGSNVISTENSIEDVQSAQASPEQLKQITARLGLQEAFNRQLCGKPINTVVIPAADEPGALDVYALASETQANVIQFGGHVKVRVGADGKPEGALKGFSNSCIALPKSSGGKMPEGYKEIAIGITLPPAFGDTPTEIHVFKSLSHKVMLMVMAGEKTWSVDGDRIMLSNIKPATQ
jgi:hypothetical protein